MIKLPDMILRIVQEINELKTGTTLTVSDLRSQRG